MSDNNNKAWATTDTAHAAYLIMHGASLVRVEGVSRNRARFILGITAAEAEDTLCKLFGSEIQRYEQLRRQLTQLAKDATNNQKEYRNGR